MLLFLVNDFFFEFSDLFLVSIDLSLQWLESSLSFFQRSRICVNLSTLRLKTARLVVSCCIVADSFQLAVDFLQTVASVTSECSLLQGVRNLQQSWFPLFFPFIFLDFDLVDF